MNTTINHQAAILNVQSGSYFAKYNGQSFDVVEKIGTRTTLDINGVKTDFYCKEVIMKSPTDSNLDRNLDYLQINLLRYLFASGPIGLGVVGKSLIEKGWAKYYDDQCDSIEAAVPSSEFYDESGSVREEFAMVLHLAEMVATEQV